MKRLLFIIGIFFVIGIVVGCAGPATTPEPTPEVTPKEPEPASDSEVTEELDDTYIGDEDLDVGDII